MLCPVGQAGTHRSRTRRTATRKVLLPPRPRCRIGDRPHSISRRAPARRHRNRFAARHRQTPNRASPSKCLQQDGEALVVLPLLVYGDPPLARVDSGRMVTLSSVVPLRDHEMENRLAAPSAERSPTSGGTQTPAPRRGQAIEFGEKLKDWDGEVRGVDHESFYRAAPLMANLQSRRRRFRSSPSKCLRKTAGPRKKGDGQSRRCGTVLRAWREGHSLVSISGGGFAPIPADWLERFGESAGRPPGRAGGEGSTAQSPATRPRASRPRHGPAGAAGVRRVAHRAG